jgi:hypothetical protein
MSTPPTVRVSDDPGLLAATRAAFEERIDKLYPAALARVRLGEWVYLEQRDALRHRRGRAVTDLRAVAADSKTPAAGRVSAALVLRDLGEPDGDALLTPALSDPSPAVRHAVLKALRQYGGRDYDLSPPERAGLVLELIDDPDPAVAAAAADVAVDRRLPGADARLALRLVRRPDDPQAWALRLAQVADNPGAATIAALHLFRDTPEKFGHWPYAYSLRQTLRHPDPAVREPIRVALRDYCLRFPSERYSQHLVRDLADVADATTIPVLEDIAAHASDPASRLYAVQALARLEPERAVDRVLDQAQRAGMFYADDIATLCEYARESDADRVIPLVRPTDKAFTDPLGSARLENTVRLLLTRFGDRGRREVESWFDRLTGFARMRAVWGLRGSDLRTALAEFKAAGSLPVPADQLFEAVRRSDESRGDNPTFDPTDPRTMTSAFFEADMVVTFDAETGTVPCDHDRLVMTFAEGTRGFLAPECAVQTWHGEEEDDPDVPMTVRFVHRGRVYEFTARNFGDWYDVEAVAAAVNFALADAGRPERFINLEAAGQCPVWIFADPTRFLPVAARYAVPVSDDPAKAMTAGVAYERYVADQMNGPRST